MGPERYFFEVPIYRVSEDAFGRQYDRDLEAFFGSMTMPRDYVMSRDLRLAMERHFWETYGMPWRFNQAVGWVRLYLLGSQVRGELWRAQGRRLQRRGRRNFRHLGKAFELWCRPQMTNDEIRRAIEDELLAVGRGLRRGHILDLECFRTLAAHIDWHSMIWGTRGCLPDNGINLTRPSGSESQ